MCDSKKASQPGPLAGFFFRAAPGRIRPEGRDEA